jgi:excisionase family DNA binding protein
MARRHLHATALAPAFAEVGSDAEEGGAVASGTSAEFLTVDEAASLLRVDRKTIYTAIAARQIDHMRLGRVIRIPRTVLQSWMRKSR